MNHGAHDDPLDYGEAEVPGHGPTVILSHLDGDETMLPRAVEHRLRDGRSSSAWADPVKEKAAARLRLGINRTVPDPDGEEDDCDGSDDGELDLYADGFRDGAMTRVPPPDDTRPTVVALTVCVMVLLMVVCLLAALRVGGAIAWDWAWVLAPLWVPVSVATVALTLACVWLAAMDEREAAHRRNRVTKGA